MKLRKGIALLLTGALCAGVLAGCAGKQAEETVTEPAVSLCNDGREAKLVLGELAFSEGRSAVLREIADKYEADFPNTEIEVRAFDSPEGLEKALRSGEIDLAEVSSDAQAGYVQDGLLLDIYPYLTAWEESATLTQAARFVAGSMGESRAYLLPSDFFQDVLYYRADWFSEYNEGRETGQAWYRTWDQIGGRTVDGQWTPGAGEKLGERGGLAFAGKDKLVDYFNAMVWSSTTLGRTADASAAYFAPGDGGETIFSLEKTAQGAEQFGRVMKNAAIPEALDWTQDQAVKVFQDGKAGMLLADRSAIAVFENTMPEGSWAVEAFPRGLTGTAVFSPDSFSGWGISSAAEEKEIAAHFLTFLCNADNNTHYAKVCGTLPIHLEAADLEETLEDGPLAAELNMADRGDWYRYASPPVRYRAYEGYRETAGEKLRGFISGELTQEELLAFMDEYWSAAYGSEGNLWS